MSPGEKEFSEFLDSSGIKWFYEPHRLDTGVRCKKHHRNSVYIPDFYCPKIDTYYEVSCTRQAKENSMRKIKLIRENNRGIKIIIVHPNGEEYGVISYDRSKWISLNNIQSLGLISANRASVVLKKSCIPFKKLRNGLKIFDKKAALGVVKGRGLYSINGTQIRKLRLKYEICLTTLADFLDISTTALNRYERLEVTKCTFIHHKKIKNLEKVIIDNIDKLKFIPRKGFPTFQHYYKDGRFNIRKENL